MNKKILFSLDAMIILILIVFDQFTKYLAVKCLKDNPAFVLIKGVLEFDYLENRGVAFGMLQNKRILILLTGVILLSVVVFFMYKMPLNNKFVVLHFVCAVIMAGGIGNMIDRVLLGYVIDFISFVLIDFPTFNVADCYIVCATIVMFFIFMFVFKEDDFEFISFKKSKENE